MSGLWLSFFQRLHLITTAKMNISQRWTIIWKRSVESYRNVGGSYYLIEFTPTTFEISKNKINNGDSHVGVYSSDSSSVMIIASTPLSLKDDMEYVEISSRNRHIIFNDSICNTLRTAGTYEHILPSSLNGKFIKF